MGQRTDFRKSITRNNIFLEASCQEIVLRITAARLKKFYDSSCLSDVVAESDFSTTEV